MRSLSLPSVLTLKCPSEPPSTTSASVLPSNILSATIPLNCEPSPLNCVAVIIPEKIAFPLFKTVAPTPRFIPVE